MRSEGMTIGQLAKCAGVGVETVRYYQKRGLINEPPKPLYGFRYYPVETAKRIRFIRRAKHLGFTLKEITELLQISDGHCRDVQQLATEKCQRMRAQIAGLTDMLEALNQLIVDCARPHPRESCPLVDAISDNHGGDCRH